MRLANPQLLLPLALALALPVRAAEQAGVSAAVRGEVALTRLQVAVGRQVVGGEPILLQDAIKSGERSGMQILLLDQTVFTIGPESELVIDEFVYDPKTNAGKLSAEITKGVFRFVSGKIAHEKPEDMNVKLPSGTLGVRGTMVAGRVDAVAKSSHLVLLGEGPENDTGSPAGAFIACNAGECVRINRPGYGTIIEGPDSAPVRPFRFSQEELDDITRSVSDPEGLVETASSSGEATPPVGAGPPGEGEAAQGGDTRSATEVSGIGSAGGAANSDVTLARLRTLDGVDQASTDAAQFADQTVNVNGRVVPLPNDCSDVNSCLTTTFNPIPVPGVLGDITTFDQLDALPTTMVLQYQQSGLGLADVNNFTGPADGSYDFFLQVNLGTKLADLRFNNINSNLLGVTGASVQQVTDFSQYPLGLNPPLQTIFGAVGTVQGAVGGLCANGCDGVGSAYLQNANGVTAASALQALVVVAPDGVTGSISSNPLAPVPQQLP